jgi:hypothetical protein
VNGKGSHERELDLHANAGQEAAGGMATRRCVAMRSKRSLLRRVAGSNLLRLCRGRFFSICNPVAVQSAIRNPQSAIILPLNPQFAIRNPQSRV